MASTNCREPGSAVGYRYYELGIRDAALWIITGSLSLDRQPRRCARRRRPYWRDWGVTDEALGNAQRATYVRSPFGAAWNTLGTMLQALGWHDEAAAAYRKALTLDRSAPMR